MRPQAGVGAEAGHARPDRSVAVGGETYRRGMRGSRLARRLGGTSALNVFVDPGKYQFSSCENLVAQRKTWEDKEDELRLLMDKAEKGTGGAVVNVLAYQADYVAATEELRTIDNAARAKNCNSWGSNSAVR